MEIEEELLWLWFLFLEYVTIMSC